MAWSGKLVGGLIGGMLGGPLGAGLGVTVGHVLGDGGRALELHRLDWQQHGFGESGPGLVLTAVWTARGLVGVDVRVRVRTGEFAHRSTVTPEEPVEDCALPRVFVPYARLPESEHVEVMLTLATSAGHQDEARFRLRTPNAVRRLGGSGPARAVMALVGCARAGGRRLTRNDRAFIRDTFVEGLALDEDGLLWLQEWLQELASAGVQRLSADKVARRLGPHLDAEGSARLMGWLWRGVGEAWPGEAQSAWVVALAAALGTQVGAAVPTSDARLEAWATLAVAPGTTGEPLRAAWLQLIQRWHPDRARTPEDVIVCNRRMAELNAAYRLLNP